MKNSQQVIQELASFMTLVSKPCLHRHVTRKNNTLRIGSLDVFSVMHLFILRQGVFPQLVSSTFVKAKATNRRRCRFHPGHAQHTTTPGSHCVKSSTSSSGSSSDRRHVDVNWWWDLWNPDLQAWKNICSFFFIDWNNNFQSQHMSFWNRNSGNDVCQCTLIYIFCPTSQTWTCWHHNLPTSFRIQPPVLSR